ncbi:hypothetical protein Ddye_019067 [Dipteronia dyeriana]|uniref:S-protein homolog n=1 Tax=Dipteronia dyeriana TaxID=168575 RepID=A0AAD9TXK8_9ROSI|nr:hypothetical protein Ddye_019067 [Dipteronia dyeriana]
MTASRPVVVVVAMWLMVICSSVDTVAGDDLKLFTIHVKDDMASGTPCVTRVNCTGFWNKMWPGQEFHYSDLRKSRVACTAIWNDKDSIWQAFDPWRDAGHLNVYTSIREDGFYFSFDQSNWTLISKWFS